MTDVASPGREVRQREASPAVRLAAFGAVLAVVFAASFGVGRAAAPTDPPTTATTEARTSSTTAVDHEGHAP